MEGRDTCGTWRIPKRCSRFLGYYDFSKVSSVARSKGLRFRLWCLLSARFAVLTVQSGALFPKSVHESWNPVVACIPVSLPACLKIVLMTESPQPRKTFHLCFNKPFSVICLHISYTQTPTMSEADWSQRIYFITNNVIILYPAHRVRTNKLPFPGKTS